MRTPFVASLPLSRPIRQASFSIRPLYGVPSTVRGLLVPLSRFPMSRSFRHFGTTESSLGRVLETRSYLFRQSPVTFTYRQKDVPHLETGLAMPPGGASAAPPVS